MRRTPPETEAEAIRLYRSGWTRDRVAAHLGISAGTVTTIMQRHGWAMRRPGGANHSTVSHAEYERTIAIYNETQSFEETAKRLTAEGYYITRGAVHWRLKYAGIVDS